MCTVASSKISWLPAGDGLGLPSIQEETGSEDCASPDEDACRQQVTPSRQITPAIRRRSGAMSSAKLGSCLPASPVRLPAFLSLGHVRANPWRGDLTWAVEACGPV